MNVLESLSPERYISELPFLLENLAVEYPEIHITVSKQNLALLLGDLRSGIQQRPTLTDDDSVDCLNYILANIHAHGSIDICMTQNAAIRLASDLEVGTHLRRSRDAKSASENI